MATEKLGISCWLDTYQIGKGVDWLCRLLAMLEVRTESWAVGYILAMWGYYYKCYCFISWVVLRDVTGLPEDLSDNRLLAEN